MPSENNGKRLTICAVLGVGGDPSKGIQHGWTDTGLKYAECHICRDSLENHPFEYSSYAVSTYHELAHTAHYAATHKIPYTNVESKLRESFATTIGWYMTKDDYPGKHLFQFKGGLDYSGAFIDLCDGIKGEYKVDRNDFIATIIDNVNTAMPMSLLGTFIRDKETFQQIQENIIATYSNGLDEEVKIMFDCWNGVHLFE